MGVVGFLEPAQYELLALWMYIIYVATLSVIINIVQTLFVHKNLNNTNGQSDIEQMLRTIATA